MKYGIFGGTFNPPHIGHVHAANSAAEALDLKILLIPDNIPPHKQLPEHSASTEERLEMVRIMSRSIPESEVSDIEIKRGKQSYTADTLTELKTLYPDDELYLIVGTDMLTTLHKWYHPERIFTAAAIAALARDVDDRQEIEEAADFLRREYDAKIVLIDAPALPVSSSQVRDTIYNGGEKWLPEGVFDYIRERGLYKNA